MLPTQKGSFRLFRLFEIQVFLHWSWFVVAVYEVQSRNAQYSSMAWNAAEYLGLFLIVTMHEFGHALACRSAGGQADQIVLWPLGGVAYVNPPPRPGATLWSIAAGPLVNVVLFPFLLGLVLVLNHTGLAGDSDLYHFFRNLCIVNVAILVFNLLPIYPLDGGQILRALLWFWLGRGRSLKVASIIGLFGAVGLLLVAVLLSQIWLGIMAVFVLINCWRAFVLSKAFAKIASLPRRDGFQCPSCRALPVLGPVWTCSFCNARFDTFETGATCPNCQQKFPTTQCTDCGCSNPFPSWRKHPGAPPSMAAPTPEASSPG